MIRYTAALAALAFALFPAAADDMDDLFSDAGAMEIEEAAPVENPEQALFSDSTFQWSGDLSGSFGSSLGWEEDIPHITEWTNPDENLLLGLKGRLWFDARPDSNFRVFGKFTTEYPFATDVSAADGSQTVSVVDFRVFELFTDFNWKDRVFFRFGKQNTGWGVSRFYQIGDPLSVGVKDPTDPAADLEGPLAFRVTVPFGLNSLVFVSALKDSYLADGLANASLRDAGAGVKADFLVRVPKNDLIGNGQLSIGAYGQRHLAPKAVVSYSTSVWLIQVFTDQVLSWGLDSYRLSGDGSIPVTQPAPGTVYDTDRAREGLFWSATAGAMASDNTRHFSFYAEYLFNGAGSRDADYYAHWMDRFIAEQIPANGLTATLSGSELGGHFGMHNSAASVSFTELFGNDDLSLSATWLQNWSDRSGMVLPSLTWTPVKHLALEGGVTLVWGRDGTEWTVKNSGTGVSPVRTACHLALKLTDAKF